MPKRLLTTSTSNSAQIDIEALGPAGSQSVLIIEAIFKNRNRSDWENDNSQREFLVSATLSRAAPATEDLNLSISEKEGGSFFLAPPNAARMEMGSPGGKFDIKINENGELAFVEFRTFANHWQQASDAFSVNFGVILSHLSYTNSAPVWVSKTVTRDLKHEVQYFEAISPYRTSTLISGKPVLVFSELDPIYALYREALNSSSPHYRMLCFYKIMEGIFKSMRPRVRRLAKTMEIKLDSRTEIVPDKETFPVTARDWSGKSITEFYNNVLTKQFRDAVAHFTLRDTGLLHLGNPQRTREFSQMVHAAEVCARIVINNHEQDLAQVSSGRKYKT